MFTAGDSAAPIWALIGSLFTLAGMLYKQHRDEKREKRLTSGSVRTTQAEGLWDASDNLRRDMAAQIERLLLRVTALEQRNDKLERHVESLTEQLREARSGRGN